MESGAVPGTGWRIRQQAEGAAAAPGRPGSRAGRGASISSGPRLLSAHILGCPPPANAAFTATRGSRPQRAQAGAGWESLTATQLTVASYVAQGLSNPEIAARMFVSRRTTQTHVSHILARLGLSSRVELAAAHARRQGREPGRGGTRRSP
ncbi:response regulator transcription factor [Streptomyces platensis]|uniref:helix-turn-helix transcriptional regulator n=1 Tax=Streptomyces platensis TaxID=58346 RepID=UPI003F63F00B